MARMLMIDNYDSFTFNLVQLFLDFGLDIAVHRSDEISLDRITQAAPDYIVISPGPKDPAHAGISIDVVRRFHKTIPMLGVCLGMQCINEAFGGRTLRAPLPVHGKTSRIHHQGRGIFAGLPSPFAVARYHSLMTEPASDLLEVTAQSADGVIMGLQHTSAPLYGVQFHPESFLTEHGPAMAANFLALGPIKARTEAENA